LHQTYHRLSNRFDQIRWYSEVMRLKWKLILVHLDIVLILTKDGYIVYAECSISLEIVLYAPDGTPR
jgi:hypothetical protein